MTSSVSEREPACVICGRGGPTVLTIRSRGSMWSALASFHRRCLIAYRARMRERGDAWARSPRGRMALAWLRVRLASIIFIAAIVSILGILPIAVTMSVRAWHLRRVGTTGARRFQGTAPRSHAACRRSGSDPRGVRRDVGAYESIRVRFVSADEDSPSTPHDRAIWEHWRPNRKMPARSGVVLVRARVACTAGIFP